MTIALLSAWAGFNSWLGGYFGGRYWVSNVAEGTRKILKTVEEKLEHQADFIAKLGKVTPDDIHQGEIAVVRSSGSSPTVLPHRPDEAVIYKNWTLRLTDQYTKSGYYSQDDLLVYMTARSMARSARGETLYLIRPIDHALLEHISEISRAEVVLFNSTGVLTSSIRDQLGYVHLPTVEPGALQALSLKADTGLGVGTLDLNVESYRGFVDLRGKKALPQGRTISAFAARFTIRSVTGATLGNVVMFVPKSILMYGPYKIIGGSFVLLVLSLGFTYWSIRRTSKQLIAPVFYVSTQIAEIAAQIRRRIPKSSLTKEDTVESFQTMRNMSFEIWSLQNSFYDLDKVIAMDIAMEEQLESEKAKRFFAEKMATLGKMAASVAHEVNTPLSVITTSAGQMKELLSEADMDRASINEIADRIESTAFRIARIVSAMKALSRLGSADPFVPAPLNQILEDCITLCQQKFRLAGVHLSFASVDPQLTVDCRPTEVGQVLLNLLGNALDAVQDLSEKWVQIEVQTGERIEISVTNSGQRISHEIAAKLFEPFFTTKSAGKGTGLGLSTARQIIESHGGMICLDLRCPQTRFTITLPQKQPREAESSAA